MGKKKGREGKKGKQKGTAIMSSITPPGADFVGIWKRQGQAWDRTFRPLRT